MWKPEIGERFIYENRAVLICTGRRIDPRTNSRCLVGKNVTRSGYLDDILLDFDRCRPYSEPQLNDRVRLAVDWFEPLYPKNLHGICKGYAVRSGLKLAKILLEDRRLWLCQICWLEQQTVLTY